MPIPSTTAFERTYNSLSGVDIKAVFYNQAVVNLQAVSYAVQREKAPVYTMGYPDPRAFSRGKRGIAGTLIFAIFDSHALIGPNAIFGNAKFFADIEEIRPSVADNKVGETTLVTAGAVGADLAGGEANSAVVGDDQTLNSPWYSDQIPPFDIVLSGANELGTLMSMKILGVEILNEGYGISIDDLMSEMQMTYVARSIVPWTRFANKDPGITLG